MGIIVRALVFMLILLLVISYLYPIQASSQNEGYRVLQKIAVYPGSYQVNGILSRDGRYIVATNHSHVILYDSTGKILWMRRCNYGFSYETMAAISDNDRYILHGSKRILYNVNSTTIHFVALYTINGSMLWCRNISKPITHMIVLDNGTSIISTSYWIAFIGRNGIVYKNMSTTFGAVGMALAENKGLVAIATHGHIMVTDGKGNVKSYIIVNDSLEDVDVDSRGRYIATGGHRDTVYLYLVNGTLLWEYNVDTITFGNVTEIAMSRDSNYIYVGTDTESSILAFDRVGRLLWWYRLYGEYVIDLKTTMNGSFLLLVTNKQVKLFDRYGDLLWSFAPSETYSKIKSADMSLDGRYIIVVASGEIYYIENLARSIPHPRPYSNVTVVIGNYTVGLNDTTLVNITVLNDSGIAGGYISIHFNNSIIKVLDVLGGDLGQPTYNILDNGTVKIAVAGIIAPNKSKLLLARLLVKGVKEGSTILGITKAELNDENGNLIKPKTINGTITVTAYLKGDVNHNGRLDTGDATLILQMIVGLRPPDLLGDLNNNGRLDTGDVTLLLRIIVGLEE